MKLRKLDNDGKPTDTIAEYDDKVAKEMLAMPGSKWVEATKSSPDKSKSDSK